MTLINLSPLSAEDQVDTIHIVYGTSFKLQEEWDVLQAQIKSRFILSEEAWTVLQKSVQSDTAKKEEVD